MACSVFRGAVAPPAVDVIGMNFPQEAISPGFLTGWTFSQFCPKEEIINVLPLRGNKIPVAAAILEQSNFFKVKSP
jgi:hypothetical protein